MKIILTINEVTATNNVLNTLNTNVAQLMSTLDKDSAKKIAEAITYTDYNNLAELDSLCELITEESNGALTVTRFTNSRDVQCFEFDFNEEFMLESIDITGAFLTEIFDGLKSIVKGVALLYHTKVKAFIEKWNK